MNKSYRQVLDTAAGMYIREDIDLYPRVLARLNQRKTLMERLRARPALAIALVILALLLLTGVAYAIGRLTGYIPGVGLIDQSSPIRVLAEPASQSRDGITLTVTEAVLTSDKTVILFALDGVQWSMLPHDENVSGCTGLAEVRLPDGTSLHFSEGGGGAGQNRYVYAPIPAGIDDATLILPCIQGALPGKAPEDWRLPLHFKLAPADMTVVPVIEIAPTPTLPGKNPVPPVSPLSITKVMEIGDTYVVFGESNPDQAKDPAHPDALWQPIDNYHLTDGNGNEVVSLPKPNDIERPTASAPDADVWAFQIGKSFLPPLTISSTGIYIENVGTPQTVEFEWDVGENPKPGQLWTVNQDFTIDGYSIRLVSIAAGDNGYTFSFEHPPVNMFEENSNVLSIEDVNIAGYTPVGAGGGSGGDISKVYEKLPIGALRILISIQHLLSLNKKTWQIQWTPSAPAQSLYGISLHLDKFIPLDDGYYLIGHTEWSDDRITSASPAGWALKAFDAQGQEVPVEPANWQEARLASGPNQWLYKIDGKSFHAPVRLRAAQMSVSFQQPVRMTLDMRAYPFSFSDDYLGVPYKTGMIPLSVPGILASAFKATYVKSWDLRGFEIAIQADSALQGLSFVLEEGLDTSGLSQIASGGGSSRDDTSGLVLSTILTNARMSFPLVFRADGATVNGDWETIWIPPAAESNATSVTIPSSCVTLEQWKRALASPASVPADLPNKILLSRGALAPDPSLFLSTLDGQAERALVFGQGSLSPDGSKLVYSGADNKLYVMNVATKEIRVLTNGTFDERPLWSPDGTQIAFTRQTDKGANVFVMDATVQNPRALTDTIENTTAVAWMPDSQGLVVERTSDGNTDIELLRLDGEVRATLVLQHAFDDSASISPDGQWLAFLDPVPGRMNPGIYLSRWDGTGRRLLVQLETEQVTRPLWSPDGRWLSFVVLHSDALNTMPIPALVDTTSCQVVPLPQLNGIIEQWLQR